MSAPIQQIPLRVRFPNRYTGGYISSTVTEKLKYDTIAGVKKSRINGVTDTVEQVLAIKGNNCCVGPK
jgi:hypothetical protein